MKIKKYVKVIAAVLCTGIITVSTLHAQSKEVLGAGATFPYPLYSKMFDVYNQQYSVKVNYQSIGSGGGIQQLLNKTVDFGATDAFMSNEEMAKSPQKIVHIPLCLGSVVLTYNLEGNPQLSMTPEVVAGIYLGKITTWNDPKIQEINPSAKLPKTKILVVHRSDGSGTSYIFTDYLSRISDEWKTKVGTGKSVNWPTGLAAKGNEGVTGLVKQSKGSIGYCELAYAIQNTMPTASLRNSQGNYVKPDITSTSLAAEAELPEDTRVMITNTSASQGYPIASFTWIVLYQEQNYNKRTLENATTLVSLLNWMITDGQRFASPLHYAPLSDGARDKAVAALRKVTFDGQPVLK